MARVARVVAPNYPHHVTQRGNRRQKTFFNDSDYTYYLELMSAFCRGSGTEIWAYCLMPNHVHLVMVASKEYGLRAALGEAHRRYTGYINNREGWRGHLWQERFHSFVMDEEHLLATVRYVERNPVAAKLCARPEHWRWFSAKAHICGKDYELVRVKPMLDRINDWHSYLVYPVTNPVTFRVRLWCQCKARCAVNGQPFTSSATRQWRQRRSPFGRARKRSSAALRLLQRAGPFPARRALRLTASRLAECCRIGDGVH